MSRTTTQEQGVYLSVCDGATAKSVASGWSMFRQLYAESMLSGSEFLVCRDQRLVAMTLRVNAWDRVHPELLMRAIESLERWSYQEPDAFIGLPGEELDWQRNEDSIRENLPGERFVIVLPAPRPRTYEELMDLWRGERPKPSSSEWARYMGPSDGQLALLKELGYKGLQPGTRDEATALIDRLFEEWKRRVTLD